MRWASDGNTQLARVDIDGQVTEYRLAVSYGTAPKDLGTANQTPFLIRITGSQVPADSGSPQAINLVDYNVTRVSSCSP